MSNEHDFRATDVERIVLGDLALHPGHARKYRDAGLTVHHFVDGDNRLVWSVVADLLGRNLEPDWRIIASVATRDGVPASYVAGLIDTIPRQSDANIRAHIDSLNSLRLCRLYACGQQNSLTVLGKNPQLIVNGFLHHRIDELRALVEEVSADDACSLPIDTFLATAPTTVPWLAEGLVPGSGISLWHGQPRAGKSLVALEVLLALSAGIPPFGHERLEVNAPANCWYVSEEDQVAEVAARLRDLRAGRQYATKPSAFRLSVHKGISLDDPAWQDRLIFEAIKHKVRVVAIDPIRAVSEAVDKGPGELAPLTRFLRRFIRETGAVVILLHHDTKLRSDGKVDRRPRAHRASGGGILSIADAPIHFDRASDSTTLLVPTAWKFSRDPRPLKLHLEVHPGSIRIAATEIETDSLAQLGLQERVLVILRDQSGNATWRIASAVGARKEDVKIALEELQAAGKVDLVRRGNANKWFLREGGS